jgi:uncharacterized protein YndB with AHSA1/START domain
MADVNADDAPRSSLVSRVIPVPRAVAYRACLDPEALATWRVPASMSGEMHEFDGREGGSYRMSLTYLEPADAGSGKSGATTDTFGGRFLEVIPNQKIVELVTFESPDPRFGGELKITTMLSDADDGTKVAILHEGLPSGVRVEDNELGTAQALAKLAQLLASDPAK